MFEEKFKQVFIGILAILFIMPLYFFPQEHPYLLDKGLLNIIQNEVSGERAWDMVSKISRFHRIRGGGEGSDYNACVEWLAQELEKIGIRDVRIKKYKADGFKKYFLWNSLVGWRVKEAELWLLKPTKKLMARFSDQAVSLMPYSQGANVETEVVYVGDGKSDDEYKGKDIKGKIVFAVGGGGSQVHREAVLKRGAVGVLVGPTAREDRVQFADLIEVNRLSPTGEEREKTGFGFSLSRRQEKELMSYFRSGKRVFVKAVVNAELFDGDMPVLEAVITGKRFPSQEIIIMGHLDHYKPGANDNASGSAGMIEMVRNIIALIEKGAIPPPKRTLRFLWVPEMHGTVAYQAEHLDLKERGIAGMNLDMIGEDYALCQTNFTLTCSPYSVPGYINDVLINLLEWLDSRDFYSPRGSKHRFHFRINPYSGGSDHVMFSDSTFSVPTPMLGHSDVFHHTNLDTPEKCDPTEMKRIISLALAASLVLANAGDDDAVKIAREVYSQSCLRMMERTQKSLRLLHQYASEEEKRKLLPELYANVSTYPQAQALIEATNIKEVKELCQSDEYERIIDKLAENLQQQANRERDKIDSFYEVFLDQYKIKKTVFQPGESYKKASSLRPKRLFKGPLPRNILRDRIGEERFAWYSENRSKAGGFYDSKQFEIINLMNGERSILDIRNVISCEFDETDIEFVLRFAQDLQEIGLIR